MRSYLLQKEDCKMKNNKLMLLLKGIILENPVLVLVLGTCPTLAQSSSVMSALGMGVDG